MDIVRPLTRLFKTPARLLAEDLAGGADISRADGGLRFVRFGRVVSVCFTRWPGRGWLGQLFPQETLEVSIDGEHAVTYGVPVRDVDEAWLAINAARRKRTAC